MVDLRESPALKEFVSHWNCLSPIYELASNSFAVSVRYWQPSVHWGFSLLHAQGLDLQWTIHPTSFLRFTSPSNFGLTVRPAALSLRAGHFSFSQKHSRLRFTQALPFARGRSALSVSLSPDGVSASTRTATTLSDHDFVVASSMTPTFQEIGLFIRGPQFSLDSVLARRPDSFLSMASALLFTHRSRTFSMGFLSYGNDLDFFRFFVRTDNCEDPTLKLRLEASAGIPGEGVESLSAFFGFSVMHQKYVLTAGLIQVVGVDAVVRGTVSLGNGVTLDGTVSFDFLERRPRFSSSVSIDIGSDQ
jgi:hypothetical protein